MKQFEYKVIVIPTTAYITTKQYQRAAKTIEETLNSLGAEGWELVQRVDGLYFLKREISSV